MLGHSVATVLLTLCWLVFKLFNAPVAATGWLVGATTGALLLLLYGISNIELQTSGSGEKSHRNHNKYLISTSLLWSIAVAALLNTGIAWYQLSATTPVSWPWLATATDSIYGNLYQRNLFASLTSLGLVAVFFLFQRHAVTQQISRQLLLLCCVVGVIFLASGNAMSGSRTGATQWLAIVLLIICYRKDVKFVAFISTTVAVSLPAWITILPMLTDSNLLSSHNILARIYDSQAYSRIALWSNVLELVEKKPWLGHGWRSLSYAHYSTDFGELRFMELLDHAHNLPLHLAVELGIPVSLGFCSLVVCAVFKAKPWAETQPDRQMAWGMLLVIGIHSMLEYPLWYGPFFLTAMLCVTILLQDRLQFFIEKWSIAGIKYARYAIRLIAISLLCFTAFAAFDYHRVSQIYLQPEERSSWYADDALGAAQKSVLFQSHAKFAELVITPLSRATAPRVLELSSELIHWSPEPRVIEKLIESSVMMGLDDLAAFHLKRYRVAYPQAHAQWAARAGLQPS